ncbi:MAG TPA: protein kinase [Ktedonobacterales bacterium]|nr:protein kinase [Ktedonobacterales bacterium]
MGWNDLIGMRLDQYDILDELGRGGSSRVYHAYDIEAKRDVAIKVIPNDAEDRALFLNRFVREVDAVRQLHHPNIVGVYGAGENDEFVYLVMQCVTGGTLRRKLNGPLPVPEAVAYMVQIAYALHHAHSKGIVHRDVKPSNMLLEYPGSNHLLLTDFGIAKIQGARGLTKSGTTLGTPEYMSPEQAEGREIDERADIYALGCVLYETLAGRPPFMGSTPVSVLFQHVHSRPAYIRGFNPGVPAELVHILEIALAKRPDERYGSAESFARALRPFAGEMPDISAQQPDNGPIVIAHSRGLTPTRPLPAPHERARDDVADRDTIENPPIVAHVREDIYEETTAPLPAISARKTMPPFQRANRGMGAGRVRKTTPVARGHKTTPPSRARKTLPPFVRVRRAPSITELGVPLGQGADQPRAADAMGISALRREPIPLALGRSIGREAPSGFLREETAEQAQRAPNSRPGVSGRGPNSQNRIPATQPRPRKSGSRLAVLIAAVVILVLFGGLALNAPRFGIALGGNPQPTTQLTVAPTSTTQPTATPAPTNTAGPQPTATQTQQQILNQQAFASFRNVTLATFSDGNCSSGNGRSTFGSGQNIYVNYCTSGRAGSAPMTIAFRHNGQVVYTLAYNINIAPSSWGYYLTSHAFSPGSYDVLVTLNINGATGVARDLQVVIN